MCSHTQRELVILSEADTLPRSMKMVSSHHSPGRSHTASLFIKTELFFSRKSTARPKGGPAFWPSSADTALLFNTEMLFVRQTLH